MIIVASTRADDHKEGSNYGANTVDIAAPGGQVPSLDGLYTDHLGIYQGTSFAAPHVAGAAALILAAYPQLRDQSPTSANAVVAKILCGADVDLLLAGNVAGNRRLNLLGALTATCP